MGPLRLDDMFDDNCSLEIDNIVVVGTIGLKRLIPPGFSKRFQLWKLTSGRHTSDETVIKFNSTPPQPSQPKSF